MNTRPPDTVDPKTLPYGTFDTVRNEKVFTTRVIHEAGLAGWSSYHTYNSQRSQPGFPDLVMVRGTRLIFAELKMPKARTTQAQDDWLEALRVVPGTEVYLWRPDDAEDILEILK